MSLVLLIPDRSISSTTNNDTGESDIFFIAVVSCELRFMTAVMRPFTAEALKETYSRPNSFRSSPVTSPLVSYDVIYENFFSGPNLFSKRRAYEVMGVAI